MIDPRFVPDHSAGLCPGNKQQRRYDGIGHRALLLKPARVTSLNMTNPSC
jgi:hypothetical protein